MNLKETLKLEAINRTKERVAVMEGRRLPWPHSNVKNAPCSIYNQGNMYGNAQGRIGAFIPS